MSRRLGAGVLAAGLLAVLMLVAFLVPMPYVVYSPGPTVNLLGKDKSGALITVSGTRVYRDGGAIRLLTVVPTGPDSRVFLPEAFAAWLRPTQAVYRYSDIYQPTDTPDVQQEQGQVEMVSSQDSAIAAALSLLGYSFSTSVQVLGITRGGPGDGALEVHDRIVAVDGVKTPTMQLVVAAVKKVKPHTTVVLDIERGGKAETLRIKTTASKTDPKASALQITIGEGYDFPIQVHLKINSQIGGPSAGLMFALAIYDTLTPGSLTGGGDVAGTGEIDAKGNVGAIGGIQQKMAGAQAAGARLFLAPASNCDEAKDGPYNRDRMRVVRVSTLKQAISDLDRWRKNHDVRLPTC